jgi:hypothetical protein
VRTPAECLEKAAEFDALAAETSIETLKQRYVDIAAWYRLLAKEREWLINTGAIDDQSARPQKTDPREERA